MQYFLGKKDGAYNRFDFAIVALRCGGIDL